MASFVVDIQFYVDDLQGERFSFGEITQAYDIMESKYKNENNKRLAAAVMLLNKEIIRITNEFSIKADTTGVESTTFQNLSDILESRKLLIKSLESQMEEEKVLSTSGFALQNRKTILRGIND